MKHITERMMIKTDTIEGFVLEVIDGEKIGWQPSEYYRVRVTHPRRLAGENYTVRLREVKKAWHVKPNQDKSQ